MAGKDSIAPKISQDEPNHGRRWHDFMPYQGGEIMRLSDIIAESAVILAADCLTDEADILPDSADKERLAARLKYGESELRRMSAQVAQARGVLAYMQMWSS